MSRLTFFILSLALFVPVATSRAAEAGRRPNVILFFADDMGTVDLNCYGSRDLVTPNLDKLAERGVRFSQFYVASPVCSPSRAALLTGRCPQRAGVPSNVSSRPGGHGLPAEQMTMAELVHGAGYQTGLVGKWHLGTVAENHPLSQGFDYFFGHKAGCIDNYSHFFYWGGPHFHDMWRNREEHWERGTHFTDLIVRESSRFLESNRENPFLLYVPFNIPHYPMQGSDKFREMYTKLPEPRRAYAAMVSQMDDAIGKILAKVDALGLRDDTLIIFLSDHGHSTEERCNFGGGSAGPYRGSKFSLLEGGIRVPAIAALPGRIPAGEVRNQFAVSVDWFPTIAEYCGVQLPKRKIDGRSLVTTLEKNDLATRHEVYNWQYHDQWAVRTGDWKLVVNGNDTKHKTRLEGDERIFLSNLAVDDTETKNIAAVHPAVVERLTKLHEEWAAEVGVEKSR